MSNRVIRLLKLTGFSWLLLILVSCATQKPKLSQVYLPEAYSGSSGILKEIQKKDLSYKLVLLNDDPELNELVIKFWKNGYYRRIINKEHPYTSIEKQDILVLRDVLENLLDIYYYIGQSADIATISNWSSPGYDSEQERCCPLTNYEIQFMMNSGAGDAFPLIHYTMLVVSAHELMLQKGGEAIYPKVLSAYLRQRFGLPDSKTIENTNLFAVKSHTDLNNHSLSGFVFCRKNRTKQ